MIFTFENVYENKDVFIEFCQDACIDKFLLNKFKQAKTEIEFMKVIYNNFDWINENISYFRPKFDSACNFSEGYAAVRVDKKQGYIKTDGTWLIKPKFKNAYIFSEGFAGVYDGKNYGFIRPDGSWLIKPKFDEIESFNDGLATVRLMGKYYKLDTNGTLIVLKNKVGHFNQTVYTKELIDKIFRIIFYDKDMSKDDNKNIITLVQIMYPIFDKERLLEDVNSALETYGITSTIYLAMCVDIMNKIDIYNLAYHHEFIQGQIIDFISQLDKFSELNSYYIKDLYKNTKF